MKRNNRTLLKRNSKGFLNYTLANFHARDVYSYLKHEFVNLAASLEKEKNQIIICKIKVQVVK